MPIIRYGHKTFAALTKNIPWLSFLSWWIKGTKLRAGLRNNNFRYFIISPKSANISESRCAQIKTEAQTSRAKIAPLPSACRTSPPDIRKEKWLRKQKWLRYPGNTPGQLVQGDEPKHAASSCCSAVITKDAQTTAAEKRGICCSPSGCGEASLPFTLVSQFSAENISLTNGQRRKLFTLLVAGWLVHEIRR